MTGDSHRAHFPTDYDQYASTYAWTRWAVPWVVEPLLREAERLDSGDAALEIGCGTANYLRALAAERSDLVCVGLDLSVPMLRQARARRSRTGFAAGDAARDFPLRDASCALAFAVDVVHHIADLERFFVEAARVLRPGGRLLVVTDSEETLRDRSLVRFFPEILAIELERYPPLAALHRHSAAAGLTLHSEEPIAGEVGLTSEFLDRLAAKCSSAMRLLTGEQHAAGMRRVREAQARGEAWRSRYVVLRFERKPAQYSANASSG